MLSFFIEALECENDNGKRRTITGGMFMKLRDKVAVVTGGASGIGRAIALSYAAEGAKVVIFDINDDAMNATAYEIEKAGGEAMTVRTDVSSSVNVRESFAAVLKKYGTVDILVNNAGIFRSDEKGFGDRGRHLDMMTIAQPKTSLRITSTMSDEEWEQMIRIDLNGVFYCSREALRIMEDKGYGRIINIASIAGISAIASHAPNYSAAKGGVVAFTKSVAHEVAGSGITVNCIAPGYVTSPTFEQGLKMMGEDRHKRLLQIIPVGRVGEPDDVAHLAVFLASDLSSYMVGQIVSCNGGVVI
jgi:3-oxoacyl-[acyl-carrier protein] reductase